MGAPIGTRLSSDEAFLRDPRGRHVVGRTFVYFCIDESFFGLVIWSTPDAADMARLARLMPCELAATIPPHGSLVHLGGVEHVDGAALGVMTAYVEEHAAALAHKLTRQALVYGGDGMSAMVVAGFVRVATPPYPARVFASTAEALAWLAPDRAELAEQLDAYLQLAVGAPPAVAELRAILELDLRDATLAGAAAKLGCTARTLQRRLREAGTTFQREHAHVWLARAKRLLVETDTKVAVIGLEVGFASASHFGQEFRKQTGMSPDAWRRRG